MQMVKAEGLYSLHASYNNNRLLLCAVMIIIYSSSCYLYNSMHEFIVQTNKQCRHLRVTHGAERDVPKYAQGKGKSLH